MMSVYCLLFLNEYIKNCLKIVKTKSVCLNKNRIKCKTQIMLISSIIVKSIFYSKVCWIIKEN